MEQVYALYEDIGFQEQLRELFLIQEDARTEAERLNRLYSEVDAFTVRTVVVNQGKGGE